MTADHVLATTTGPVLEITLHRPDQLNAQLPSMWDTLSALGAALDPEIRVVVIRGAGRSFSAGLDRRLFGSEPVEGELTLFGSAELDGPGAAEHIARWQDGFSWLRRSEIISIAAVQGHAIGAGFQLALACDLRVVADDAQFAMAETGLGLVPDLGGTGPLVDQVGYSRALELCVTGRRMGATEAYAAGLATVVVPRTELDQATADLVAAVTAPASGAVRATKALLLDAGRTAPPEQRCREREAQVLRLRELAATARA